MTVVRRYLERTDADAAWCALDAAGIPAHLADENITRIAWLYSIALGGTRIEVPEERCDEADAVLTTAAELDESETADGTRSEPSVREDCCSRCGSADVAYTGHERRRKALSLLLLWFGVPVLMWGKRLGCRDCGDEWRIN